MISSKEMFELLSKKEELNKELIPYLEDGDSFKMLRHPIIYSVPHFDNMNAYINKRYSVLKEEISKCLEREEWEMYVYKHERPYRLQAFLNIYSELNDSEYWDLLSSIWIDSENIWQNKNIWITLLKERYESKHLFMSQDDRNMFDALPDEFMVYRGYLIGKNEDGLSYTTDKKKAQWFSKRFSKDGAVISKLVRKEDVFAYTNERDEKEIIIIN